MIDTERLLVVAEADSVSRLGPRTIVIGWLNERELESQPEPSGPAGPPFASLTDSHWGDYVAIDAEPGTGTVRLLRAPMGGLPCYWAHCCGLTFAASDLALLMAAGVPRPQVDFEALARNLAAGELLTEETCLAGIAEIRGGLIATFSGGAPELETCWSPWAFARGERAVPSEKEAAVRIGNAVTSSIAASARRCRSVVLKLSGGLDSSIVAAALACLNVRFEALNLVTRDPSGDERRYARIVAAHLEIPLEERYRDVSRVDLERSLASRLPRPSVRSFLQETARIAGEAAVEAGAGALFDGGGGDNVFCSLQSARPAADALIAGAGLRTFARTVSSIAALASASLLEVARSAVAISARSSPAFRWPHDVRFLSSEARALAVAAPRHPWLEPPPGVLPGKAAHVAMVAAAQSVAEGFDAEEELPTVSPLIAQPVVEACLEAPSWLWFEQGRNRALARRAFASLLPAAIVERRSKGAPDSFIAELFEANREKVRDILLGGWLRTSGLLDADALDRAIGEQGPVQGHDYLRIMRLVDAEIWARAWA